MQPRHPSLVLHGGGRRMHLSSGHGMIYLAHNVRNHIDGMHTHAYKSLTVFLADGVDSMLPV
jgi:hypothetical protein